MNYFDVIVIGGGQSGLAVGYYLRRTGLSYIILDSNEEPGGAWQHTWKSLRLFSPAQWSSLPGTLMQGGSNYYPTRDETIDYLRTYESKYALPVKRPVQVESVTKNNEIYLLQTSDGLYSSKAIVSATGSFTNPYLPGFPGQELFDGKIIHSSSYLSSYEFTNMRVAVVGEGNSGAQILAEVSQVADMLWITQKAPRFLPDNIDGRYLFDAASQMYAAQQQGKSFKPPSLGDIVVVDSVKEARSRNVFVSSRPFDHFTTDSIVWSDGRSEKVDAVIFCTGFKSSLRHFNALNIFNAEGRIETTGTKARSIDGLWLVGYGNWTGFASATLIGVGRSAKSTADEIVNYISVSKVPQVL